MAWPDPPAGTAGTGIESVPPDKVAVTGAPLTVAATAGSGTETDGGSRSDSVPAGCAELGDHDAVRSSPPPGVTDCCAAVRPLPRPAYGAAGTSGDGAEARRLAGEVPGGQVGEHL